VVCVKSYTTGASMVAVAVRVTEGVRGDPEVTRAAARGASYEGGALNACGNPQLTIRSGHHAHLSVGAYSSGG
jgi:hypothetical protein